MFKTIALVEASVK